MTPTDSDVLIIGAGPAGAIAAALLVKKGHSVRVIERQQFPRFSIGESLLAHCLDFVEEAGMLKAVHAAGFQYKNGAVFFRGSETIDFNFAEKTSKGFPYTFQVQRAIFDKVLADEAARQGAEVLYQEEILGGDFSGDGAKLTVRDRSGTTRELTAKFVLDASGYGRTLPKLLKLETPSHLPSRRAYFTHIKDNILPGTFDRQKIRVTVHPKKHNVWFWTIPFSNGRASVGVVGLDEDFAHLPADPAERLKRMHHEDPGLSTLLKNSEFDTPVNELAGYSANVKQMAGHNFALLGNAAEFLDPVFSSGVTIAMKSASMASKMLDAQLRGQNVDWKADYEMPLRKGIDAFKTYVNGWYDGRFQTILFYPNPAPEVKAMICSVLAGYAWDPSNPFAAQSESKFATLYELCRKQ